MSEDLFGVDYSRKKHEVEMFGAELKEGDLYLIGRYFVNLCIAKRHIGHASLIGTLEYAHKNGSPHLDFIIDTLEKEMIGRA